MTMMSSQHSTLYHCTYCSHTYSIDQLREMPAGCTLGGSAPAASSPSKPCTLCSTPCTSSRTPSGSQLAVRALRSMGGPPTSLAVGRASVISGGPSP